MEKQEQDKLQIERLKEDNQNLQEVNLYIMWACLWCFTES